MHPFKAIKITDKVYWVGGVDWNLRDFHGYSTSRGTTYNAYLVLGDEPILIDTVKAPFHDEMMSRIRSVIDPKKITYLISNHSEMDHSGSMPRVIEEIQPKKIFASKMGVLALQKHFHANWDITEIHSGDGLELNGSKFVCLETRMLHWPDSMVTYFENEKILFSQDGFGMHFATMEMFASRNNAEILRYESSKYFANILLPYSAFVLHILDELEKLNLDIKFIAPDHGPIWDSEENIKWILTAWRKWATQAPEKKAVILYDTMWQSTESMAKAMAEGFMMEDVSPLVLRMTLTHRSDVITEILEAGALMVGSPTLNQQMFPSIADAMCYIKGLMPKNLIGQAFGSYGWSNKAVPLLQQALQEMHVKLIGDSVAVNYVPTTDDLLQCQSLGQLVAQQLKQEV
jgi:flavorubredoxin